MDAFPYFYEGHEYTNTWERMSTGTVTNTPVGYEREGRDVMIICCCVHRVLFIRKRTKLNK